MEQVILVAEALVVGIVISTVLLLLVGVYFMLKEEIR